MTKPKSWSDIPQKDKDQIIKKSIRDANKEQSDMMNKPSDIWDKPSKEWEQAIMSNQNILEDKLEKLFHDMERFITPRDEINFKEFVLSALAQQKKEDEEVIRWLLESHYFELDYQKAELKKLITEEIVTCQKIGEPTSRLTSLYNKI